MTSKRRAHNLRYRRSTILRFSPSRTSREDVAKTEDPAALALAGRPDRPPTGPPRRAVLRPLRAEMAHQLLSDLASRFERASRGVQILIVLLAVALVIEVRQACQPVPGGSLREQADILLSR